MKKKMKPRRGYAIVDEFGNALTGYGETGFFETLKEARESKQRCVYPKWRIACVVMREEKP